MNKKWLSILLCVCAWLIGWPANTAAQESKKDFEDTVHVTQRKPVLQKGRFEINPRVGIGANDSLYRRFRLGGNLNFHITEKFFVGGLFEWMSFGDLGGPKEAFKTATTETSTVADSAVVNWVGGLELGYKPIVGKFALFNSSIFYYDWAISAGGVMVNSQSILRPTPSQSIGGTVALTSRVFLNDWLAFTFELRDYMYSAQLKQTNGSFTNSVFVGLGFSLYLPTGFEYSKVE